MKLFKQGVDVSQEIFDKIKFYQQALQNQELLVLNSVNHIDHIAAYLAWQTTPGQILILSPWLPVEDQTYLLNSIRELHDINDVVFFHTSGTTGRPKIVQHGRVQFAAFAEMSQTTFEFDSATKFLSLFPPFTSAFWHIVIPSFCQTGFEMHLSSRDTLIQDLTTTKFDSVATVPNIIDLLRLSQQKFNFESFKYMLVGGAAVLNRHAEFLFKHGATTCIHAYGSTETGSPLLARKFTKDDQHYDHCDLTPLTNNVELKLVDQELWVRSPSLCVNFKSFSHSGEWRRTGDLWQEQQGLVKFVGRNDDLVKINGYPANLLEIENWWELNGGLGECVAKNRTISGNDYIELVHTKNFDSTKKENLKAQAKEVFAQCNVPVKFTQTDNIPKTSLGKKQRHLVK